LKEQPLEKKKLRELAKKAGGADHIFSRRAIKYRTLGLAGQNLSEKEQIDWMAKEYTLISRPVVEAEENVVAGFSKKRYRETFSQ